MAIFIPIVMLFEYVVEEILSKPTPPQILCCKSCLWWCDPEMAEYPRPRRKTSSPRNPVAASKDDPRRGRGAAATRRRRRFRG